MGQAFGEDVLGKISFQVWPEFSLSSSLNSIMDKNVWDAFAVWGLFLNHTCSNTRLDACSVSRIFPEFRLCIGWVRDNCNIFSKRFHCLIRAPKNYKKSWILHFFPKDCRLTSSWTWKIISSTADIPFIEWGLWTNTLFLPRDNVIIGKH